MSKPIGFLFHIRRFMYMLFGRKKKGVAKQVVLYSMDGVTWYREHKDGCYLAKQSDDGGRTFQEPFKYTVVVRRILETNE